MFNQTNGSQRETILSKASDDILASPKWADRTFFSVMDVAEIMMTGRGCIDNAIKRGEIPAIRLGKHLRIHRKAVRELIGE